MKRFGYLAVLMVLGSTAQAGNSFSFVVGGHRIRIEAPRHCNSASCGSVSIPGIHEVRRWRDKDDDEREIADQAKAPVPAPATQQVLAPAPATPPASAPVPPAAVAPAAAVFKPAAAVVQDVAAPAQIQPARIAPPPPPAPPVEKPAEAARPVPAAPQMSKLSQQVEEEPADMPVGDWQTEGKGSVRIARCGRALCGYTLNPSSNDRGEAVLINMKPKTESQWSGSVYSQGSGDIYYGTMTINGVNTLRVEACALGRFYCSGNVWTRITGKTESLMTSRQILSAPRS